MCQRCDRVKRKEAFAKNGPPDEFRFSQRRGRGGMILTGWLVPTRTRCTEKNGIVLPQERSSLFLFAGHDAELAKEKKS
jgi:hypothetical protein